MILGHTAYHVPTSRVAPGVPPPNRPGVPPLIVTWADPHYLKEFCADIAALRPQVDIVVASCHWGLGREPLQYMTEIGRAAIDAGADIVIGHGPHYPLPVEVYKGRPIFYGLCNLTFATGHHGRAHSNWIGMLVELAHDGGAVKACDVRFVRANANNETFFCRIDDETETLANLGERSKKLGAIFKPDGDRVRITP